VVIPKLSTLVVLWCLAIILSLSRTHGATITVNAAPTSRPVDARHFGLNAAVWDGSFKQAASIPLLREMGCTAMRFPGGSTSDDYHWAINRSGTNSFTWATSFTDFAIAVTNLGAQAIVTVNYGGGTAEEAAAWVRHSNVTNSYRAKYWEIGNECYGTWEHDTNSSAHSAYTYATRAADYFAQMKAADPTIKIGIPVDSSETTYANGYTNAVVNPRTGATRTGWTPVVLATLKDLGVTPDFLVYHRYAQGPGSESDATLLQSNGSWATDASRLRQILNDYVGSAATNVELLCTENNSVYSNPGKQTTSLVNGLFFADSIATAMKTEFNAVIWWDLRNGKDTNNNNSAALYGWRGYGDYGVVSGFERYPACYVFKLLQYFARGGDFLATASSSDTLLSTYAVRRTNNALMLLVINKDPSLNRVGNFTLQNFTPRGDIVIHSYGIPEDEAARTGVGWPDLAAAAVTNITTTFSRTFAPYSVSVLTLAPAGASNAPPTIAITTPGDNSSVASDHVNIGTSINDDGIVTRVDYFANGQWIGQTTNQPHTLTWSNVAPGSFILNAEATDHLGLSATSSPVRVAIALPALTLISTGSVWRYLDTGTNLGTTWRSLSFIDTNWPAGPAQLGFGDGDEATLITSNRQWTTYFRRTCELPSSVVISNLALRLLRDDGAVVYVNNTEVWRSNMPLTGSILYNTPASSSVPAADETTNFYSTNITSSLLIPGTNIVAVEVHQNAITSSDLSFDFEMIAFPMPLPSLHAAITNQPGGLRIRVAWPVSTPTSFVLQHSGSLTNAASGWFDLTGTTLEGTDRVFYDPFNSGQQFYRLKKP